MTTTTTEPYATADVAALLEKVAGLSEKVAALREKVTRAEVMYAELGGERRHLRIVGDDERATVAAASCDGELR